MNEKNTGLRLKKPAYPEAAAVNNLRAAFRDDKGLLPMLMLSALIAWLFYSGLLVHGRLRTGSDEFNYFRDLARSFTQGRLDIYRLPGQMNDDLTYYGGKYYIYWPPVPALVFLAINPFKGLEHDRLINASFGAVNSALVILLFALLSSAYGLGFKRRHLVMLWLFWTLGTVHFYMSMQGSVWFISQVMHRHSFFCP